MPRRTWCPQAFVPLTVLVPVPTGATSATAAAPIVVVDSGVDDALYVGPFYSQMPYTTTDISGVFHQCVVNHFVSDAFPKVVRSEGVDVYLAERFAQGRYPCPIYGTCICKGPAVGSCNCVTSSFPHG